MHTDIRNFRRATAADIKLFSIALDNIPIYSYLAGSVRPNRHIYYFECCRHYMPKPRLLIQPPLNKYWTKINGIGFEIRQKPINQY
jgi:hypothetical protein